MSKTLMLPIAVAVVIAIATKVGQFCSNFILNGIRYAQMIGEEFFPRRSNNEKENKEKKQEQPSQRLKPDAELAYLFFQVIQTSFTVQSLLTSSSF